MVHSKKAELRYAGATLLFLTRTSKSSPLRRCAILKMLLQLGIGVGVGVFVGVGLGSGVEVSAGVLVGTGV